MGVPALPSGGRYTKRTEEKLILHVEEESPSPVPGEQTSGFVSHSERGVTKELLPEGLAATLSLLVEEEMLPPFVVEEESMSPYR